MWKGTPVRHQQERRLAQRSQAEGEAHPVAEGLQTNEARLAAKQRIQTMKYARFCRVALARW
ncbi:hypothetical protein GCM10027082_30320 [Comamonas humi]